MKQPIVPLNITPIRPVTTGDAVGQVVITEDPAAVLRPPPSLAPHDVEACANAVLDKLPRHIAEAVREISLVHNRYPVWVTVAGLVNKAYENGEHQAPVLDAGWGRSFDVPETTGSASCEYCGQAFTRKRYKQRFCTNDCGHAANALLEGKG